MLNKYQLDKYKEWKKNLRVSQLIEILQSFNPEAHIMIDNIYTSTGQYLQQSMIDNSHGSLIFIRVTV